MLTDDEDAEPWATEHRPDLGHRRITMMHADLEMRFVRDRRDGYRAAMARADAEPSEVSCAALTAEAGRASATRLLFEKHPPTPSFAVNDWVPFAAADLSVSVPEE